MSLFVNDERAKEFEKEKMKSKDKIGCGTEYWTRGSAPAPPGDKIETLEDVKMPMHTWLKLRAMAVKWMKCNWTYAGVEDNKMFDEYESIKAWIKYFFNLTEEDLK